MHEQKSNYDWVERQLGCVPGDKIRGTDNNAHYIDRRREMLAAWSETLSEKA